MGRVDVSSAIQIHEMGRAGRTSHRRPRSRTHPMFGFNREKRQDAVKKDLIDLHVILQRLEGIPQQTVRHWPKITGPLGHCISTVSVMRETLACDWQKIGKGGPIPRSVRRDLQELANELQTRVNQNRKWLRDGLQRRRWGTRLIRDLDKLMSRLHRHIDRFKEPDTPFQKTLNKLMNKCKIPTYALAQVADVDPSYLQRLRNGERRRPGRDVVIRLATAMAEYSEVISDKDVRRLIESAGHTVPKRLSK